MVLKIENFLKVESDEPSDNIQINVKVENFPGVESNFPVTTNKALHPSWNVSPRLLSKWSHVLTRVITVSLERLDMLAFVKHDSSLSKRTRTTAKRTLIKVERNEEENHLLLIATPASNTNQNNTCKKEVVLSPAPSPDISEAGLEIITSTKHKLSTRNSTDNNAIRTTKKECSKKVRSRARSSVVSGVVSDLHFTRDRDREGIHFPTRKGRLFHPYVTTINLSKNTSSKAFQDSFGSSSTRSSARRSSGSSAGSSAGSSQTPGPRVDEVYSQTNCCICFLAFPADSDSYRSHLLEHMQDYEGKSICPECFAECPDNKKMVDHFLMVHGRVRKLVCPHRFCGQSFRTRTALYLHTYYYHE